MEFSFCRYRSYLFELINFQVSTNKRIWCIAVLGVMLMLAVFATFIVLISRVKKPVHIKSFDVESLKLKQQQMVSW